MEGHSVHHVQKGVLVLCCQAKQVSHYLVSVVAPHCPSVYVAYLISAPLSLGPFMDEVINISYLQK